MVKETIRIFARLKPVPKTFTTGQYELVSDQEGISKLVTFSVPKDASKGVINNRKQLQKFSFEQIFEVDRNQVDVFTAVARPVIDQVLQGYNGTVFAYGQTGSGKTFTITGGGSHESRGIIPLTIDYIFQFYKKNQDTEFTTQISYLEIYNEVGRDLLTPGDVRGIDDLSKVTPMEDVDQNIHLKNLSIHTVTSREESLDLLFQGDFNRVVAATPMNPGSTRSHCIYTIHITSRPVGSSTFRRAKFHLVDLAGSERVSKTGASGILLTEAKFINESLHHLEKVIVALSEPGRSHIPYRDSILTNVLRDSLGGNCMTTMIATCSVERRNLDETISTCRFAQRVAMIKNDVELNEEFDPKLLIDKLKREIVQLKEELALVTGEQPSDALSEEDLMRCRKVVATYLEDSDPDADLNVGLDLRRIQLCFKLMKDELKNSEPLRNVEDPKNAERYAATDEEPSVVSSSYQSKEQQQLCSLLQQRDNEITILVNLLKKEKKKVAQVQEGGAGRDRGRGESAENHDQSSSVKRVSSSSSSSSSSLYLTRDNSASVADRKQSETENKVHRFDRLEKSLVGNMSVGRKEAFELFRRDHALCEKMESGKRQLKQFHAQARQLGDELKQSKTILAKLTDELKKHRMLRVLEHPDDRANAGTPDGRENSLMQQIIDEQKQFKEHVAELKLIKEKCDHREQSLAKDKLMIVRDFEKWWGDQANSQPQFSLASRHREDRSNEEPSPPPLHPQRTPQKIFSASNQTPEFNSSFFNDQHPSSLSSTPLRQIPPSYDSRSQSFGSDGHHSKAQNTTLSNNGIVSTGDPLIDETIKDFYFARQNYCQQVLRQGHQ